MVRDFATNHRTTKNSRHQPFHHKIVHAFATWKSRGARNTTRNKLGGQTRSRLCVISTGGPGLVLIVRRWAIFILSPLLRGTWLRCWRRVLRVHRGRLICRIHMRRRSRPCRRLSSVRVRVSVGSVSWTRVIIWDDVVSIPRPSNGVGTLRSLSCSLRVRILVRILLGMGAVRVK